MAWKHVLIDIVGAVVSDVVKSWFRNARRKPKRKRAAPRRTVTAIPRFDGFHDFMEQFVLREHARRADGDTLSGSSSGFGGKPIAAFRHLDADWQVNGDTQLGPLRRAYEWSESNNRADPFAPALTRGEQGLCLVLAPAVGWSGAKRLYIYCVSD